MIDPDSELVVQAVRPSFRSIARLVHDRRCVTALEFALVAPVLLLLMFGLMDMMWMLGVDMALNYSLEEGARLGSLGTLPLGAQNDAIRAYMVQRTGNILSYANLQVNTLMYGNGSPHDYAHRVAAGTTGVSTLGTTRQVIEYSAVYTQTLLSPLAYAVYGQTTFIHRNAMTVVQNEPY